MDLEKISVDRIDELMRLAFAELKRLGGRGRPKEILAAVEQNAHLSEYKQQRTKTAAVRWDTHLRFYTTDCVKAGCLIKVNGYWNLTPQAARRRDHSHLLGVPWKPEERLCYETST